MLRLDVLLALVVAPALGCHAFLSDGETADDPIGDGDGDSLSDARLDELAAEAVSDGVTGVVAVVWVGDKRYVAAAGLANRGASTPMTAAHRFPIADNTEPMIGAMFAQLASAGSIDLDSLAAPRLPLEVTNQLANADRATIRQLLTHRSGIPDFSNDEIWDDVIDGLIGPPTESEILGMLYERPARFAPGSSFEYSATNYLLARMVLDSLTGAHHSAELRRRVLDAVPMPSAYIDGREAAFGPLARGYEDLDDNGSLDDATDVDVGPLAGGDLVSSIPDLADYGRALGSSLLDAGAQIEMFGAPPVGFGTSFGLGIAVESDPLVYARESRPLGYITAIEIQPESPMTIAVGVNHMSDAANQLAVALVRDIAEAFGP